MPRNLQMQFLLLLNGMFFGIKKKCPDAWKNGIRWVRDKENMSDGERSHIPRQWVSGVSFWENVAKHCHETRFDCVDYLVSVAVCLAKHAFLPLILKILIPTDELLKTVPYYSITRRSFTTCSIDVDSCVAIYKRPVHTLSDARSSDPFVVLAFPGSWVVIRAQDDPAKKQSENAKG